MNRAQEHPEPRPQVVIAGFGLPGRFIAEALDARNIPCSVIELNPQVVQRVGSGRRIIAGDIRSEQVLRDAGLEHAKLLVIAVPDDRAMLDAIAVARRVNPSIHITVRCTFTSHGLRARKLGADEAVVAEQLVAHEMTRLAEEFLGTSPESQ